MTPTIHQKRHVEIDLLRALALLCMTLYHAAYDLSQWHGWTINLSTGPWWLFARSTATLFLLLVGVSFAVSWNRTTSVKQNGPLPWKKYTKRAVLIFGCGMIISLITYIINPVTYVRFGILHLIGISIALLPSLTPLREWNAVIGIIIIATSMLEGKASTSLLPFGITPYSFTSVDYFPLIPWFGVILIGYALGYSLYIQRHFESSLTRLSSQWQPFTWISQHSLLYYLLHQPVLLLLFWMMQCIAQSIS